jgi:3,4-dihydroxy 2-butanone 4-phosphate synthase/GTP cyclohydrolase II
VLATTAGDFEARAFEASSGLVHLALVKGRLGDGRSVLTRLHLECVTGDALGSLRCDCGVQLRAALGAISAQGRGVLLYATGQELRGIGLVRKLRGYMLEDGGRAPLDPGPHPGPARDPRDYRDAAACLRLLGVRSVRLLTRNPSKEAGVLAAGIGVEERVPLAAPHRFSVPGGPGDAVDVTGVPGAAAPPGRKRPHVTLKYAQTLDGRIATHAGDSKWISGEPERCVSHALRAACDAVLVGVGTVLSDDPQLTVRLVPGTSPTRIVLDSTLRLPDDARILEDEAPTIVVTTDRSSPARRRELEARGIAVRVVPAGPGGVDLPVALRVLHDAGVRSLLVEGGAQVITSLLRGRLVDRLVVAIAPTIVGAGKEAVGDLHTTRIAEGLRLTRRTLQPVGEDLLVAADLAWG